MAVLFTLQVHESEPVVGKHLDVSSSGSHCSIERMVTRILVGVDREADREILVTVAEFRHRQFFSVPPRFNLSELKVRLEDLHHIIGVCFLLSSSLYQ
jgi:hypothetical protein